ncbi:MAG: glycosyltransferase family 39 protein [archaeon]
MKFLLRHPNMEKEAESRLSSRKSAIIGKIAAWFSSPYNRVFIAILAVAIAIRLFYFFMFKSQPLWFDEAEYMSKSKEIAFNFNWHANWSPRKPILLAWLFVPLLKIGFNEAALRFILVLFSIAAVWLAYLVAKEFFNRKIALISSFIMAVYWVNMFFSVRFLVDMPATTLFLAALYFFAKGYIKKEKKEYLIFFGAFLALGFLMRVSYGIFLLPFALYIFMEEKFALFKNKQLWIGVLIAFIVMLPFFIWLFNAYPQDPLGQFIGLKYGRFSIGQEHGSMGFPGIIEYLKDFPNQLKSAYFILFLFGLALVLLDLFLEFDLIFKKGYNDARLKFFILLWLVIAVVSFGLTRSYVEQRDSMVYAVFMFSIIGVALMQIQGFIAKYSKILGIAVVMALLAYGAYSQIIYGYEMTKDKSTSYQPVRDAGLWIKQNSNKVDGVTSKSLPQMEYYSERENYDIFTKTEEEFIGNATMRKTRFFVPSTFEPYWLVPEWSYTWGQKHPELANPVWWWIDNPEKPTQFIVVYELNLPAMEKEWKRISSNQSA